MGLRWWRPHQALSRAFEPPGGRGLASIFISPVSFRRATQTYKAVRRAIQHSQESLRALANRYGINQKTVRKWRRIVRRRPIFRPARKSRGPQFCRSRKRQSSSHSAGTTLLPLDDCLYALQATIPRNLTRSSLHRCLQRHGISRLPNVEGDKPAKKKFKDYPIGFFHIDIAEVRTEEGKLYLFVAIDRTSKFAFARLEDAATVHSASTFLNAVNPPFHTKSARS